MASYSGVLADDRPLRAVRCGAWAVRALQSQSPDWLALWIVLWAAGLRVYNLAAKGLRQDEIKTYHTALLSFRTLFTDALAVGNYSPLLYIKTRLFLFLGHSPFWVRLPSVIEGVVAVALIYLVGKTLWNRRTGLAAASETSTWYV